MQKHKNVWEGWVLHIWQGAKGVSHTNGKWNVKEALMCCEKEGNWNAHRWTSWRVCCHLFSGYFRGIIPFPFSLFNTFWTFPYLLDDSLSPCFPPFSMYNADLMHFVSLSIAPFHAISLLHQMMSSTAQREITHSSCKLFTRYLVFLHICKKKRKCYLGQPSEPNVRVSALILQGTYI